MELLLCYEFPAFAQSLEHASIPSFREEQLCLSSTAAVAPLTRHVLLKAQEEKALLAGKLAESTEQRSVSAKPAGQAVSMLARCGEGPAASPRQNAACTQPAQC